MPQPDSSPLASFLAQVAARPRAVAVQDSGTEITYADLLDAAQILRADLAAAGARPGDVIAVVLPRGWRVVAAMAAIWLHGCGYVPIDPDYPQARQAFMIADSGARVAVAHAAALRPHPVTVVTPPERGRGYSGPYPSIDRPADTPAYVIYTSGSTGMPKGVEVSPMAVAALLRSCASVFRFTPEDIWTWFHSHSFDFSVWEIWGALTTGGRVVVVSPSTARNPAAMLKLLETNQVTVLSQVPSAFRHLVRAYGRRRAALVLRYVVLGGEALDRPSVRQWMTMRDGPETLVDMYGITETTVHVTYRFLRREDVETDVGGTRIGGPLPHLDIALFDDAGVQVADGTPGEIYISGDSLADGYRGNAHQTAQAFPLLTIDDTTRRWYRSGDLARRLPDGTYEYLGRVDRQLTLRGFRIEPGETEAVLRRLPGVLDAVVDVERASTEAVLTAYVVTNRPDETALLRSSCRAHLPAHLVPDRVVRLAELPLTPSGKLDRGRLRGDRHEEDQ